METLYDILGVVPSADKIECGCAFKSKMLELLGNKFELRNTLWQQQKINEMFALIEAIRIVGHGDRKVLYHKQLIAAGVICPVCEGSGQNKMEEGFASSTRSCIACGGSGKNREVYETDGGVNGKK